MAITTNPKNTIGEAASTPENEQNEPKIEPVKASTPVKPIVEGINSFKNTNDVLPIKASAFTPQEKKLISDLPDNEETEQTKPKSEAKPVAVKTKEVKSRLMPESVIKRASTTHKSHKGMWITLVIVAIFAVAVYEFYLLKLAKNSASTPSKQSSVHFGNSNTTTFTSPTAQTTSTPTTTATTGSNSSSTPLAMPTASSTPATTTPAALTPTTSGGKTLKVNSTPTGYLNVRSLPSTSGKIISKILPGETYAYTLVQSGWYKITLSNGTSGWVIAKYVSLAQ